MTAAQFLEQFPDAPLREGWLEDVGCPKCGNREELVVEITRNYVVDDDGIDVCVESECEVDENAPCSCDCGFEAARIRFTFIGLDDLILAKQAKD